MATVPATSVNYTGDGIVTLYAIPFAYDVEGDVYATVDGVATSFTFSTPSVASIVPAPANGADIVIYRDTPATVIKYIFDNGVPFLTKFADANWRQLLYVFQEYVSAAALNAFNLTKSLRAPEVLNVLPDAATRAEKLIGFDAAGQPVVLNYTSSSIPGVDARVSVLESSVAILNAGRVNTVPTFAGLSLVPAALGQVVTILGNTTGSIGGGTFVAVAGSVVSDGATQINSASAGIYWKIHGVERINSYAETLYNKLHQRTKTPAVFFGRKPAPSAIVLLGDSNGEGVGAPSYAEGYAGLFFRAVQNAVDTGKNTDRGFRYESILRMAVSGVYGFSSTGTLIGGGVCDSRISLAPGQVMTITGREIATADVFYEASLSTGTLEFRLNGAATPYKTVTITGTGTKHTFPSYPYGVAGYYIKETDSIEIRSVGGTVVVTELLAIRASSTGPLCYSVVRQGWGLDEFNDPARVAEAATHINQFSTTGPKLVIVCLGTNNMSGVVGLQKSPTDYITALDNLIASYRTALTVGASSTKFAVWVPHKSQDASPLGTYQEYIDAITAYCDASVDTQCIRLDQSAVGYNFNYLADNRHFNTNGHAVVARYLCSAFGVPQRFDIPAYVDEKAVPVTNTPTLIGTTVAGTHAYSVRYSVFRSGNSECAYMLALTLSSLGGTASGNVRINNSAAPSAGLLQPQVLTVSGYTGVTLGAGYTQIGAEIINGTNVIALYKSGTAVAKIPLAIADITSSFSINIAGNYFCA